jgi:hypothetical protein
MYKIIIFKSDYFLAKLHIIKIILEEVPHNE